MGRYLPLDREQLQSVNQILTIEVSRALETHLLEANHTNAMQMNATSK